MFDALGPRAALTAQCRICLIYVVRHDDDGGSRGGGRDDERDGGRSEGDGGGEESEGGERGEGGAGFEDGEGGTDGDVGSGDSQAGEGGEDGEEDGEGAERGGGVRRAREGRAENKGRGGEGGGGEGGRGGGLELVHCFGARDMDNVSGGRDAGDIIIPFGECGLVGSVAQHGSSIMWDKDQRGNPINNGFFDLHSGMVSYSTVAVPIYREGAGRGNGGGGGSGSGSGWGRGRGRMGNNGVAGVLQFVDKWSVAGKMSVAPFTDRDERVACNFAKLAQLGLRKDAQERG